MATLSFTWRVDQGDVVSCVEASHQCSSHALRTLVQLQTGGGARHCTLKRAGKKKKKAKKINPHHPYDQGHFHISC